MYLPFALGLAPAMQMRDRRLLYLLVTLALLGEIGLWVHNRNASGTGWLKVPKIGSSARKTFAFWIVTIIATVTLYNQVRFRAQHVPPRQHELKSAIPAQRFIPAK